MGTSASLLSSIGNTPLVRLNRLTRGIAAEVFVKAEYLNPSGSIKDRIALRMIEDAEKDGRLKPGMEIVEASTGNTATALAFVGAIKGYPVRLFVPNVAASEERLRIVKSYGATVTPVDITEPGGGGVHGGITEKLPRRKCLELERSAPEKYWWARQFSNPSNAAAHADGTAREIVNQLEGNIDAFCAAIGTGGTLLGCAQTLRAKHKSIEIVGVEPGHASVYTDGKLNIPLIEGITGGLLCDILERKAFDRTALVDEAQAIEMAHQLAEEEGLFCGLSSGANVAVALQIARRLKRGQRVVTVLVDSRDRYLFKERLTT